MSQVLTFITTCLLSWTCNAAVETPNFAELTLTSSQILRDVDTGEILTGSSINSMQRVYGGSDTQFSEQPYIAQVLTFIDSNTASPCGGGILHKNYQNSGYGIILTAAHCVFRETFVGLLVRVGCESFYSELSSTCQRFQVYDHILHEQYDPISFHNDIALLITTEITTANAEEILLPKTDTNTYAEETVNLVGYGNDEAREYPSSLQIAKSKIQSNTACKTQMTSKYEKYVFDETICAYDGQGGMCFGDSGGSATLTSDGRTAIGITSWVIGDKSAGSCSVSYPSGFTRVSSYLDWIENNLPDTNEASTSNPTTTPDVTTTIPGTTGTTTVGQSITDGNISEGGVIGIIFGCLALLFLAGFIGDYFYNKLQKSKIHSDQVASYGAMQEENA